ncbi:Oidioi.mRNA.OKI2018_I69.chr1.g3342.t1.cds [Oikopleura dioica]|uniref:Oidioi.mRNA.OKI2018_I69.chr1.g3342.t1.cds n=1 Tax=Oikopleura dioica TaxID=34765 RepID=A0ABN7SXC7_OIKDI|nr:Oidioi.mRNA.OKI2018_I69.chr1.g3342.t1.cds [Oikopleura dioica]
MYEILREARDFASKRAPSASTFHIAECWATILNREYRHGYAILRKRDLTNIYVLLREGPPPPERTKLTTEDAIDHYLQGHREKEIPFTCDQEEENEGIKREMAEIKSNETPEAHELRNRIEELESQLKSFQSDYADLMQMDQADREATLEAIKLKYLREKDILIEREETIQALQEEMFAKDNDHRQDLEELSKFIDELRSERWKKDQEMDKLLNQLIDLEDAVEQQIAVKQFAEHERKLLQEEVNDLNAQIVEHNKELIMLKRKAEKSEEDKNTLQQDMTSAITLAQDAKIAKENEIRELQDKNRKLEEENARLTVEVSQLRRDRRGSPVLAEPVSPKPQVFEPDRRLSTSLMASTEDSWSTRRNRFVKSDPPSVQNLIQNFNKDPEPTLEDSGRSTGSGIAVPSSPGSSGDRLAKFRLSFERRESARDVYLSERVISSRLGSDGATPRRPYARSEDSTTSSSSVPSIQSYSSINYPSINTSDPLQDLSRKYGCSKRNALLKWCQEELANYKEVDVTNFSSSWGDGLALCALLHTRMPHNVPFRELVLDNNPRKNVETALKACSVLGIGGLPSVDEFLVNERPDWQRIMKLISQIFKNFTSDQPATA